MYGLFFMCLSRTVVLGLCTKNLTPKPPKTYKKTKVFSKPRFLPALGRTRPANRWLHEVYMHDSVTVSRHKTAVTRGRQVTLGWVVLPRNARCGCVALWGIPSLMKGWTCGGVACRPD